MHSFKRVCPIIYPARIKGTTTTINLKSLLVVERRKRMKEVSTQNEKQYSYSAIIFQINYVNIS